MEVQLQELIDKIKIEGVSVAKTESERIKKEAEIEAKNIIATAELKAKEVLATIKQEEELACSRQNAALIQAGRDLLLNVSNSLVSLFNVALGKALSENLQGNLEGIIKNILSSLDSSKGYEIVLSEADCAKLADALKAKLATGFKNGIEVNASRSVSAGFRIGEKDGAVFYDITNEALVQNLANYLNPKLAEEFKKAIDLGK
jgi:V/A-type H+-transporting ATPase subunit E